MKHNTAAPKSFLSFHPLEKPKSGYDFIKPPMDPVNPMNLIDPVEHRDFVDSICVMQLIDYHFDHMNLEDFAFSF